MPIDYTPMDEDLLLAGLDGYTKSESTTYRPIWRLAKGTTIVRFLTDKDTMNEDHGWFIFREVAAFDGLKGGFELPNGIKEFPVNDQVIVTDPETGERKRHKGPRGTDPLFELVAPSSKYPPADGVVKAADKVAVNVLNEEGKHIILKMSGARAKELFTAFNLYSDMDPNFTCTAYPWQLTVSGTGVNTSLSVKPLRDEPPVDLPEPYDLVEVFNGIREEVEAYVNGLSGNSQQDELVDEDSYAMTETFEETVAAIEIEEDIRMKYSAVSPVRLKTLLTKANVAIPPRSTHATLIELAVAHNV
jgi:hypothetical protein